MSIRTDEQKLILPAVVQLIEIDATGVGGSLLRATPGTQDGAAVTYQGVIYSPLPVRITGIGGGARRSEPTLEAALEADAMLALLAGGDDLAGAQVSLLETLEPYLDGQAAADSARHWPVQRWRIEALTERSDSTVQWRLASPLTMDGAKLPQRQALRDVCSWQYRHWNGSAFVNPQGQCPYRGNQYFNLQDEPVTAAAADQCSRRIGGCLARYPAAGATLPFGGFIGLGRQR